MSFTTSHLPVASATDVAPPAARERLESLDAFRGFTMAWLLGGKAFVAALAGVVGLEAVRYQLTHSDWVGLRYYDLIWPSFMLMVGTAIPFSAARRSEDQSRAKFLRGAWRRAAILFLLGSLRASVSEGVPRLIELSSALQPIAIAYLVACHLVQASRSAQIIAAGGILAGYAALLAFVGTDTIPAGTYEPNRNLVTTVDQLVLGRAHRDGWGTVLSTIPTIATTLVGLIFGQILITDRRSGLRIFVSTGVGCLVAGFALSPWIPMVMKLWTTSYALAATGWASLLFAGFYALVDLAGWKRWAFPLIVIGTNALAAYLLPTVAPVSRVVGVFTKPLQASLGVWGPVVASGAVLSTGWLVLLWLFRRKIFLRP